MVRFAMIRASAAMKPKQNVSSKPSRELSGLSDMPRLAWRKRKATFIHQIFRPRIQRPCFEDLQAFPRDGSSAYNTSPTFQQCAVGYGDQPLEVSKDQQGACEHTGDHTYIVNFNPPRNQNLGYLSVAPRLSRAYPRS